MEFSIDEIKKLRKEMSASISDCREALVNANGDFKEAKKILEKKGAKIVEKKKDRETNAGTIGFYLHQNKKIAAIVKISCESDFVAKNDIFYSFAHNVAMHIAAMNPRNEEELMIQPFIKDQQKTIKELFTEIIAKLGENIQIKEFKRIEV